MDLLDPSAWMMLVKDAAAYAEEHPTGLLIIFAVAGNVWQAFVAKELRRENSAYRRSIWKLEQRGAEIPGEDTTEFLKKHDRRVRKRSS